MAEPTDSGTLSPHQQARRAQEAQRALGTCPGEKRTAVLVRLAQLLEERAGQLLAANARDLEIAEAEGLAPPLQKRLDLSESKLDGLRAGVLQLARTEDPIGTVLRRTELDDGLDLQQVRSPLGVLLVIFESRPDAVIQIGSLALRSGNAVLLKGGREALHSNRALVQCLRDALSDSELLPDAVCSVEGREAATALLDEDALIDLVIPRGSSELVRAIQSSTRIPVLGHAEGICHLYLDAAADPGMAARIAVDGKCDYPAACNATETLLVHENFLPNLGPVIDALRANDVQLRACSRTADVLEHAEPATDEDWRTEYGDLVLSIRTVDSQQEAIDHIHTHGSGHTDVIVTEDASAAQRFLDQVDSASVFHNASSRFADGFRFGLGAEVGISTSRIHARGPVGIDGLLTTRWLLRGSGQGAGDYGEGGRSFTHRDLPIDPDS